MPSNHLILCHPFLLPPSIFPSIKVFSNESVLHIRWPEYWSFSFSMCPSNDYSGLNSFRIDWFDLLAVQETLKSLLQHHSSKVSILQCSAFFMVILSPAEPSEKPVTLTTDKRWSFQKWCFVFSSSVQSLSCMWLFVAPWTAAHQASLSITNSRSLLKLMSIELVMPSNHLILCHPLLLPPSGFPNIRVFSNESFLPIRWPKDWSFSFSISPSNE